MKSNPAYARVAAENAVRKALLSLMPKLLASVAYQLGGSAGHSAVHEQARTLLIEMQGELLAPFLPLSTGQDDSSSAANTAARAVMDEFLREFDRAFSAER